MLLNDYSLLKLWLMDTVEGLTQNKLPFCMLDACMLPDCLLCDYSKTSLDIQFYNMVIMLASEYKLV